MTILIIDDEAGLRRSLTAHLEDQEFDTLEAANGLEGLEALRAKRQSIQAVVVVWSGSASLPQLHRETAAVDVARGLFASPRFLYAFEATSILILSAMVGAIVVARKEKETGK